MTVGQRIAQKRKELGLSQEGLGERLGVSRQAIYKWESDATLPEIEKLIALSRIFSVSVGWLLGEEDGPAGGRELTAEQLRLVEEIVDRYLAAGRDMEPGPAQPPEGEQEKHPWQAGADDGQADCGEAEDGGERPRRRRWPYVLGGLAALAAAVMFHNLFTQLNQMENLYNSLQTTVAGIDRNVNLQISGITSRVEEILKSQNELTAQYGTEVIAADLKRNTVTFSARAVPKTYREGMTAVFVADSGDGPAEFPANLGPGREYSAEITCELTDDIQLSVVFITGGVRETQLLDRYEYLYTGSFPNIVVSGNLWHAIDEDGVFQEGRELAKHMVMDYSDEVEGSVPTARVVDIKVGLFRDQKLVQWYGEEQRSVIYNGEQSVMPFYVWDTVELDKGSVYCEAAVVTDEYSRVRVYSDTPQEWDGAGGWHSIDSWRQDHTPEGWEF